MTTLKVTGMTCQNCVKHVTQALQGIEGVTRVAVDLAAGTAEIEGTAEVQKLLEAVEEEGYEAEIAG